MLRMKSPSLSEGVSSVKEVAGIVPYLVMRSVPRAVATG
ncbi:MAG: hypothetical protein QOG23_2293 [Blastocatellia bacterium]|nr:hypothetical protein [Blastocatellia bacterium]